MSLSRDDVDVYSRDFSRTSQMNTNSVDVRYRNIPLWDDATLSLMAKYSAPNKTYRVAGFALKQKSASSYLSFQNNCCHFRYLVVDPFY
jgi:maltoporin